MKKRIIDFICRKRMRRILIAIYIIASIVSLGAAIWSAKIESTVRCKTVGVISIAIWVAAMIVIWNYDGIRDILIDSKN